MTPSEDPHGAIGAYVLHCLPQEEQAAFEHHLAGCALCAREYDALTATTAHLAAAEAIAPPATLRERVLDDIAHTRQDRVRLHASMQRKGTRRVLAFCLTAAGALGAIAIWQTQADLRRPRRHGQPRTGLP